MVPRVLEATASRVEIPPGDARETRPPVRAVTSSASRVQRLQRSIDMRLGVDQLASHVAMHAGVASPLAEHALRAVVSGIGGYLSPAFRQLVAEELPPELASALVSAVDEHRPLEDRVRVVGLTPGEIRELIASVCRVLAEELSDEAVRALTASLPGDIATLLVPSSPAVPHLSPLHRQANSVAELDPHGDTKLSSSRGRYEPKG